MPTFTFKDRYCVKVNIDRPSTQQNAQQAIRQDNSQGGQQAQQPDRAITLVLMTAIGVPLSKYTKFINALTKQGFTVVSADYPCCGENQPHVSRGIDYGYQDLVDKFVPALLDNARILTPGHQIIMLGHSIGAHIGSIYSALTDTPLIAVATGNIHYKNWRGLGRLNILRAAAAFEVLIRVYGYLPGYKVGFGYKEPKKLMKDWCRTAWTGKFDFIKELKSSAFIEAKANKGQGLYFNIIGDDFAPFASTQHLSELCARAKVVRIQLEPALRGNQHSVWLKSPESVVENIVANLDFFTEAVPH